MYQTAKPCDPVPLAAIYPDATTCCHAMPWTPSSCFSALPAAIPCKTRQPHAESVHSGPCASGLLHGHVRCRLRAGYAQATCALLKRPGRPGYGKAACPFCICPLQPIGPVKAQGGPLFVPWQPPALNLPSKAPAATNVPENRQKSSTLFKNNRIVQIC